ncbi:MAG: NlpC/P60 family protein [Pseudomonadota bacterium]
MSGRQDIVAAARGWVGTPYRHQASCRGAGADCLGLVRGVWRDVIGSEPERLPGYSWDWSEVRGEEELWAGAARHLSPREPDAAYPGDVLLFRMRDGMVAKHLGILSLNGPEPRFVHAYARHGVVESTLSFPWRRRVVAAFAFPTEV